VHGNAIFSKLDIDFRVVNHKHHPFDWEKDGDRLREPRVGRYGIVMMKAGRQE
jgi:hypothetical protein